MRKTGVLISFLLLCVSTAHIQSSALNESIDLEDLNESNLRTLLDWMDFDGIIYMVESYKAFQPLILDTYISGRFGFDKKLVHITNTAKSPHGVQIESDGIWINGFNITLSVLKNFGHLISRLEFNSDTFDRDQVQIIGHNINSYCARSLHQFKLNDGTASPFTQWFNEFERCESVEFRNLGRHIDLQMHRVFPSVHRLYIETTENSDMQFLEHKFGRLQQLTFDFSNASYSSISRFNNVFLLNRQLRALEIVSPIDSSLLRAVHRSLENLESLAITIHPLDFASGQLTEHLHFESVAMLTLRVIGGDTIFSYLPITFGCLRTLVLNSSEFDKQATNFLLKNPHLNRLELIGDVLSYTQWLNIIQALPELTEITAQVHESPLDVVKLEDNPLVTHLHLQRIVIGLGLFSERKVYLEGMPKQWKLAESTNERELIFVRDWSVNGRVEGDSGDGEMREDAEKDGETKDGDARKGNEGR